MDILDTEEWEKLGRDHFKLVTEIYKCSLADKVGVNIFFALIPRGSHLMADVHGVPKNSALFVQFCWASKFGSKEYS